MQSGHASHHTLFVLVRVDHSCISHQIPAVIYFLSAHRGVAVGQIRDFLLTASAIGGIIKHRSSISGAEVGCQGEVGSAAAMAAAGLCAVRGGTCSGISAA